MGSNPVYLLKSSLLYQVAFQVYILRVQKNSMHGVLTKIGHAFGKLCGLEMTETNCGRNLMHFEIEFKSNFG